MPSLKKLPILVLCAAVFTVTHLSAAVRDHEVSIGTMIAGTNYEFRIPIGLLYKSPAWKSMATPPPLDPGKASSIALAQLKQLAPQVSHWSLVGISLQRIKDDTRWGHWIYIVEFEANPDGSGKAIPVTEVPVLMDGTTIQPVPAN